MRKVHHDRFSHLELEEFGKEWKAFRDKLKVMRYQRKRKAEDLDGFNESNRESVAKCKAKKKMDDLEGFKKKNREDVAKCREKLKKENPDKLKNDEITRKENNEMMPTTHISMRSGWLQSSPVCAATHSTSGSRWSSSVRSRQTLSRRRRWQSIKSRRYKSISHEIIYITCILSQKFTLVIKISNIKI